MADQGAEGLLSPFLRKERFRKVIPYLKGKILDYGCGSGGLARYVLPELYNGFEPDPVSLKIARSRFPGHKFLSCPDEQDRFDTVVALAVLEHADNPVEFLCRLSAYLDDSPDARLVLTTPHPSLNRIYAAGSKLSLFSKHAYKEHKSLLDYTKTKAAANSAGLRMVVYQRFLLGANQLFVFEKGK